MNIFLLFVILSLILWLVSGIYGYGLFRYNIKYHCKEKEYQKVKLWWEPFAVLFLGPLTLLIVFETFEREGKQISWHVKFGRLEI